MGDVEAQNSATRSTASRNCSTGFVNTMRKKPGAPKMVPGSTPTAISLSSFCAKRTSSVISDRFIFAKLIFTIMYMAP